MAESLLNAAIAVASTAAIATACAAAIAVAGTAAIALIIGLTSGFSPLSENGELIKIILIQAGIFTIILCQWAFVVFLYRKTVSPGRAWIDTPWIVRLGAFSIEVIMTRVLQIGLFYCCYTLVYLCSAPTMNNKMKKNLIVTLPIFLLGYVTTFVAVMFWVVPFLLAKFNLVFRCPPFIDRHELRTIVKVINQHYHVDFFPRLHPRAAEHDAMHASHAKHAGDVTISRSLIRKLLVCLEVESSVSYSASGYSDEDEERHELVRLAHAELAAADAAARNSATARVVHLGSSGLSDGYDSP